MTERDAPADHVPDGADVTLRDTRRYTRVRGKTLWECETCGDVTGNLDLHDGRHDPRRKRVAEQDPRRTEGRRL